VSSQDHDPDFEQVFWFWQVIRVVNCTLLVKG